VRPGRLLVREQVRRPAIEITCLKLSRIELKTITAFFLAGEKPVIC
jgi:hypothetical protein